MVSKVRAADEECASSASDEHWGNDGSVVQECGQTSGAEF